MLKEAKRLSDLGLDIIWLHKKSKRPIDMGWTGSRKKPWQALVAQYRPGMNMGVRLGTPSRIDGKNLAVVDVDIKDPAHRKLIEREFARLFPDLLRSETPKVSSGRGGGSCHFYVLSERPFGTVTLFQQKGIGEIVLYSDGRQVVLPPSIHPDTLSAYTWDRDFDPSNLVTITPPNVKTKETSFLSESGPLKDFAPVEVDLVGSSLPSSIVDMILTGEGVENRSDALLRVSNSMVKLGFKDIEILSVLTDPETFLGKAAFEHRKTSSRKAAAAWIEKYTLAKAKRDFSAEEMFKDEVVEVKLSPEAAEKQTGELTRKTTWREKLDKTKDGRLRQTYKNVKRIFENVSPSLFKRNTFSLKDIYGVNTPWGGKTGRVLDDDDTTKAKDWLVEKHGLEAGLGMVLEAISAIALNNEFHPVRDYLNSLEWDGTPRIDTWLKDYMGAVMPEPYLSEVSRKVLCAMVARIFKPGCTYEFVLVMEGPEGIGKSTASAILASEEYFVDRLPDLNDKDAMLGLQGIWVVELSELAGAKRADSEQLKAFFASRMDKFRVPYGRKWKEFPRQSVFMGTTNERDYLKSKTGNRRFWPVEVTKCEFDNLKRDRDQLLAEAKFAYELGEFLNLTHPRAITQARVIQDSRISEDEESGMDHKFAAFLKEEYERPVEKRFYHPRFSVSDLFDGSVVGMPFGSYKEDMRHILLATAILRRRGFEKKHFEGRIFWHKR